MGSTLSTGPPAPAASKISTGWFAVLTSVQCDCAMAAEQRFVGIGKKNSSKVVAPPGGKSSIGFGEPEEALKPLLPKTQARAVVVTPAQRRGRMKANLRLRGPREHPTGQSILLEEQSMDLSGDSLIKAHGPGGASDSNLMEPSH